MVLSVLMGFCSKRFEAISFICRTSRDLVPLNLEINPEQFCIDPSLDSTEKAMPFLINKAKHYISKKKKTKTKKSSKQ